MAETMNALAYAYLDSPVGRLLLAGDDQALTLISFPSGSRTRRPEAGWHRDEAPFGEVMAQLRSYFAGELTRFELPLRFIGTDFQRRVWIALRDVPYGQTTSYGALARRIGRPKASRAVGAANGANPLPIVVPCHRVIGAGGDLRGFGGGLPVKQYLLAHERQRVPG